MILIGKRLQMRKDAVIEGGRKKERERERERKVEKKGRKRRVRTSKSKAWGGAGRREAKKDAGGKAKKRREGGE